VMRQNSGGAAIERTGGLKYIVIRLDSGRKDAERIRCR
jgi:hypothetical protein